MTLSLMYSPSFLSPKSSAEGFASCKKIQKNLISPTFHYFHWTVWQLSSSLLGEIRPLKMSFLCVYKNNGNIVL